MAANQSRKTSFYNDPRIKLIEEEQWDSGKTLYNRVRSALASALKIQAKDLHLEHPLDESHGDFATSIALINAGKNKTNPRELAEQYLRELQDSTEVNELVENMEIAGPGFINLKIKPAVLASYVNEFAAGNLIATQPLNGKRIMFEYAHPNPFKSFHIGHLRNIILGESLIRILEKMGAEIIRTNYQGDVGMHIAKCLWSLKQVDPKTYPDDVTERVALLGRCYAEGAKKFEEDEKIKEEIKTINKSIYNKDDARITKLWEMGKLWSLDKFHELYQRVYSTFEREYMESETLERSAEAIAKAKAKGILKESDGALIFDGKKYGLDTRVFLNSRGLPTYEGKELGLAYMEFSDFGNIDLCIHNVAVEQISFFKVTFKVEELLDPMMFAGKQYHNAYEFVGLKSGKMSSRTGKVVLGEDILNEAETLIRKIMDTRENMDESEKDESTKIIAVGAVKYSFLNISPSTYLAFDIEKSLNFEGNSGPYLQYTFARANKLLNEATTTTETPENLETLLKQNEEKQLLSYLYRFQEAVTEAAKGLAPNLITSYLFELAQRFNQFYRNVNVLQEQDKSVMQARLLLTRAVANVLSEGLDLLGIKTVAKM